MFCSLHASRPDGGRASGDGGPAAVGAAAGRRASRSRCRYHCRGCCCRGGRGFCCSLVGTELVLVGEASKQLHGCQAVEASQNE